MPVKNITIMARGNDTPGMDFELFLKGQLISYYRLPRSSLEAGKEYQTVLAALVGEAMVAMAKMKLFEVEK